ncbi:uncharacterized protein Z519_06220 [Cladophialophora bantiana CBS 173.52]|uniref:Cytochrome P450 n=1 Tax=Cladophialophora bantiana (strain ATCC 10958 / CBS 173.52 / CDC B-1940 / NIH 8579) TaxID=1442370 RepID=A0A0D2HRZ2_CLAB1|nr:uncharacterized protein Z519_06220 [Cladophialophora bantiana CBS 173.52]KIW93615.1 hypothetical protein Z519_06220 [Cladophialophora bantiana CBS 173.52]
MDAERENLFTELNDDKHSLMRAKLSPGYSGKDSPECEPSIDQMVMDVVRLIKRKYLSVGCNVKPLDWAQLAQYFILAVITYLSLGEAFGFVSDDTDKYTYVKSMEDNFPIMNVFSAGPLLSAIARIPTVQANLVPSPKEWVREGQSVGYREVARQIIAGRFSGEKAGRYDMVTSFKNHGLSELEISDESLFQLLAGSDTTAIISGHKVIRTMASTFLPGLKSPFALGICIAIIQRYYGADAEIFRPERWLEASPERLAVMEEAHHLVFGNGRFRCMGENIARLELNKIFERIRKFD